MLVVRYQVFWQVFWHVFWRVFRGAFRAFLVASAFFFFWATAVVLAWTFCPILAVACPEEPRRWRTCQRVVKPAFRLFHAYMRVLRLLEVQHSMPPSKPQDRAWTAASGNHREQLANRPAGPLVIVCNHPTLVDVTAILSRFDDVCCVVKASLFDNVFVGRLLRTCGHIRAGGEAMSGAVLMHEALRRFDAGLAVLIFPESTRSPPGGLHAFRRGAFELAVRARVPLWPLLLTCNPPALSKGLPFWRQPDRVARLRVQPGDLMTDLSDARSACQRVETLFSEGLRLSSPAIPSAPLLARQKAAPRAVALSVGLDGTSRDEASHSA
jgi:1-acyl-sn-glycerol-3-phosphate acyltransferase